MKIQTGHFYVLGDYPGISGFRDFSRIDENVVTATKARRRRAYVLREYVPTGAGTFRLDDGHLPECQPRANELEALRWLEQNPFQSISFVKA